MMAKTVKPLRYKPSNGISFAQPFVRSRREPLCGCGGVCAKFRSDRGEQSEPQALAKSDHAWNHQIPAIVDEALETSGHPLAAATRSTMEAHFGHDFAKVRVHNDAPAAQAARAVHARAFTLGYDIVMGAGLFAPDTAAGQHLLAHELTHVVQQSRGFQRGIQRQDDEKQKSTPTRDEFVHEMLCGSGGAGLFGRTRVSDVFRFSGTFFTNPAEVAAAEIEDLRTGNRDLYYIDSWLDDEWRIVKVELDQVIVVNSTCGTEEVLGRETRPTEPHPQTIEVGDTNFGPGTVTISENCRKIVFQPNDRSKPVDTWTAVTKGESDEFYVRNGDETDLYPPPQVEDFFRLYLLGDRCGEPKPKRVVEPSMEEMIP